jgi:hypothetical protein
MNEPAPGIPEGDVNQALKLWPFFQPHDQLSQFTT